MRAMVVDDDSVGRRFLARFVADCGFETIEAEDGRQAAAQWHSMPVDLVLTDLEMPHLNGIGLTAWLRREGSRVPVILMTGHDDAGLAQIALQAGVTAFLPKPADPDTLRRLIATLVSARPERKLNDHKGERLPRLPSAPADLRHLIAAHLPRAPLAFRKTRG